MGDGSQIEWTDATWNPVRGCARVSEGCRNCYAEHVARRFAGPGQPYEGLVRLDADGNAKAQWNGVVHVVRERLADPLQAHDSRSSVDDSLSPDECRRGLELCDAAQAEIDRRRRLYERGLGERGVSGPERSVS